MPKKKKAALKVRTYHDWIEPGAVSEKLLAARVDDLALDPALWVPSDELYSMANELARRLFGNFEEVDKAYAEALYLLQNMSADGETLFNRLEGSGMAVERRLLMASYFIGLRCGRMVAGGAR